MDTKAYYRNFDLESIDVTLRFCQQEYGDVNCVVWDASLVLAKYLETLFLKNNETFKSKRVIELGSGLGCVGLAAACFGANVKLTDLPENLPQLQQNVEENTSCINGSVQTVALTWGTTFESEAFDFLLMADCIYYPEVVEALVKTITELTTPKTVILICQELRETEKQKNTWKMFLNLFLEHFDVSYVPEEEQHPIFSSSDIIIINAKKKCM
ncbi:protein-lysine methyltransferase METTL21D-like [Myzus persicae]|uniref:protein-lysine methyltransferase METTL21D-like n=1 Tax=Myzus persicae TaxID=13164 RepID=UPI000B93890E|nr:protein-lysine methyltransferase METTL21D-like [Myzus persicae]